MNQQLSPTRSVLLQMLAKLPPPPSLGLKGTTFPIYYSSKCTVQPSGKAFQISSMFFILRVCITLGGLPRTNTLRAILVMKECERGSSCKMKATSRMGCLH